MMFGKLRNGNSIFKPSTVSLEDLSWLFELGEVEGETFELKRGLTGNKLRTPVSIPVPQMLAVGREGLIEFIVKSLIKERPKLIPFVFRNSSMVKVAEYLRYSRSGSGKTLYLYAHLTEYFSRWAGAEPDKIISDIKPEPNGLVDPQNEQIHCKALENFVAHLQDRGLAPNRVVNYLNAVKTLYATNGIHNIDLANPLRRQVVRRDRAPKPEELKKLIDCADLREKVITSLLSIGAFREGTLVRLKYRHVKHDLEKEIIPLHIHVEAEITKGKYGDYDTFIGPEAVHYLKLYLDDRRKGGRSLPPEEITDESPLIRDEHSEVPKPIGEKQVYQLIHRLYKKAGLLNNGESYHLRVHSLRKFFKTNLLAIGVQPDYVDYMMGHTVDTYHDVQNRLEDLRTAYRTANLSLFPKPQMSKLEILKAAVRSVGLDPEKVLVEGAIAEPHRVVVDGSEEEQQEALLSSAIKEALKKEIFGDLASFKSPEFSKIPTYDGGVAEI